MPPLYAEEEAAVASAVSSRQDEFRRGRACARAALRLAGGPAVPIPRGDDRGPVWPDGFIGSITHCTGFAAAVAAPRHRLSGIGVDAEPAGPLPGGTRRVILHAGEHHPDRPELERVVFGLKECVHKALFPLDAVWLDFLDVTVDLDLATGHAVIAPAPAARATSPRLAGLRGGFAIQHGFVLTAAYLP